MTDFTFKNTLFWTGYASCAYFHVINLASYFRVGANRFSGLLVYEHENVSQVYQKRGKNSTLYKLYGTLSFCVLVPIFGTLLCQRFLASVSSMTKQGRVCILRRTFIPYSWNIKRGVTTDLV